VRQGDFKTGGLLLLLSLACVGVALIWEQPFAGFVAFSAAFSFLLVSLAYLFSWPRLLGKKRTGHLLPSSYLLFWPYHLLNYLSLALFRLSGKAAPFNEIEPGLYLGSRLFPRDQPALSAVQVASVLDLTAEFPEVPFLRRVPGYLCIPLLDRTAPTKKELEIALRFIQDRLSQGPVYVHCALGHGRSATVVLAYLLASDKFPDLQSAITYVRTKRPGIKLHSCQKKLLAGLRL